MTLQALHAALHPGDTPILLIKFWGKPKHPNTTHPGNSTTCGLNTTLSPRSSCPL